MIRNLVSQNIPYFEPQVGIFLLSVTPSPVKGKGKVGRPTASKASKEKTPSPKEEDEEPESPLEKKTSSSPPPEKSGDEGSEDEAQSGED